MDYDSWTMARITYLMMINHMVIAICIGVYLLVVVVAIWWEKK